jgi:LmbE family N-acetylglucosaminyl deacetylase
MARDHKRTTGAFVQGTGELLALMEKLKDMPLWVLEDSIRSIARSVAEEAKRLAPDDPNDSGENRSDYVKLKESVRVYYQKRKRIWVVRFATRHAAAQHERMDWQHQTGQPKYLEIPLQAAKADFLQKVGANVDEVLAAIAAAKSKATTTDERRLRRSVRKRMGG